MKASRRFRGINHVFWVVIILAGLTFLIGGLVYWMASSNVDLLYVYLTAALVISTVIVALATGPLVRKLPASFLTSAHQKPGWLAILIGQIFLSWALGWAVFAAYSTIYERVTNSTDGHYHDFFSIASGWWMYTAQFLLLYGFLAAALCIWYKSPQVTKGA